jgi:anaerobic selenocysteine-containing dehydrogenase
MCVSACGATATVVDGRFAALEADPSHPTGRALCVKGKAAPEIAAHRERLLYPLRRTAPKGAVDPAWERIGWDEALGTVASRLRALAGENGPECVVFGASSPSTTAISDAVDWIMRLRRAFGSPNLCASMELCGWGRYLASMYTYGAPVPGVFMPDLERAGCILLWGYNPSVARLSHATATVAARRRGARLIVIDPRRAGLASEADHWLRVRPGTDAALALALTGVMIERGWYDAGFVRRWTNGPLLVRNDTGRLLRDADGFVAWDEAAGAPVAYDPARRAFAGDPARLALGGAIDGGGADCRTAFDRLAARCREMPPDRAAAITGVPAEEIEAAARTIWESRPLAYYSWSGLEQHGSTSQTIRAINVLFALTGGIDAPGGNVRFTPVPSAPVDGAELLSPAQRAKAIGLERRPLGPARFEFVTGEDLYRAALEGEPYRARGLVNFGANFVVAHGDSARGRAALAALDFFVHTDLFMSPTAELADVVLPAAAPFEAEALRIGFEVSQEAQALVQLRRRVAPPRGEARSDTAIIFDLAARLGLGEHFWDGDVDAGLRHRLAPSGVTLEQLRAAPEGVRLPLETRHRKHAEPAGQGYRGFGTPSGLVELFSEAFADAGHAPLPEFEEPRISPRSRPDLAAEFPLILTSAKALRFCESQHRNVASLRRGNPDPQVELHPDAAAARGIGAGDWVRISTPNGSVTARARLNAGLDPGVVCGQHGWWQGCEELGLPAYPPLGPGSANLNGVLSQGPSDPISGSSPLRASVCEVTILGGAPEA